MNAVLEDLLNNGCELIVTKSNEGQHAYIFKGFYKYGEVQLTPILEGKYEGKLLCTTRYGITKHISSFEEFKEWNIQVWEIYKDSFKGWSAIEYPFNIGA
jgi:hypothetical protein